MSIDFEIIKIPSLVTDIADSGNIIIRINMPKAMSNSNSNDYWILLKTLIEGGVRRILIDMTELETISSMGISILINSAKLIRTKNGDIALTNVSEDINNILKLVNFHRFIGMYESEEDGLKFLRFV